MSQFLLSLIIVAFAILTGCQKKETPTDAEHNEAEEGAVFKAGHGLSFSPATKAAIGLETAEAETRGIAHAVVLAAQVYRTALEPSRDGAFEKKGMAYASALLDPKTASALKVGDRVKAASTEGRVARVDTTQEAGLGKSEVLIELPDPEAKLSVGTFVPIDLTLDQQESVAIPASAVLETADGLYAYVQNGESLLRTPVTTGRTDGEWVEITDGLYEGDSVAIKPVSSLYLIELRATKGGGHCH